MELDYETLFQIYKKGIDSQAQRLIVGIVDNKIIGFCSLTIKKNLRQASNLAHVDELVIDKNYRGNGYGKTLIDSITRIAKDLKCKRIELDSAFHRKEAHMFYEPIGYENRAYLFSKKLIRIKDLNNCQITTICLIHKGYKGFRALSPESSFGGKSIGLKKIFRIEMLDGTIIYHFCRRHNTKTTLHIAIRW